MIELFPHGFEEVETADGVELVAYTDPGGEERLWHAFGGAAASDVAPGWEDRWREFHRPVEVDGLWIGPPWVEPPAGSPAVTIDPGRAFGTGGHATTRLSLRLLAAQPRGSVLDVGCGSGVLAIAAVKLGFGPVVAVDVDAHAVEATLSNAAANGVALDAYVCDATTGELPVADLAILNVTREVIEQAAHRVPAERLVTSGYLESESPQLEGFRHVSRVTEDGWAADAHERIRQ